MAGLRCVNMKKCYDNKVVAVQKFNIDIKDGEFIVLVGPSGCGKSTLLRMIAGLESISEGELYIEEQCVNKVAPSDRNIAMVFQNYALYGNMTVYENMGFSLIIRHENDDEIHEKVMKAADAVDLKRVLNSRPANLSGGQRQRVALGRSIVRDSKIFLLDEPLSNLDAKLRTETRRELVMMHKQLKSTFIYVTHDQIEAMTMADRMVIMKDGIVQQIGTPLEVYKYPCNMFVAGFIGTPEMNFIEGKLIKGTFISKELTFSLPEEQKRLLKDYEQKGIVLGIRPEDMVDKKTLPVLTNDMITCSIKPDIIELLGADMLLHFELNDKVLVAKVAAAEHFRTDSYSELVIFSRHVHFFNPDTTERIGRGGTDLCSGQVL